jgi:CRP/FNR family cyclic AMP-dependent transcriptional regulator
MFMEDAALLGKVSFFENLEEKDLMAMVNLKTGQRLFAEGDESDAFFIIKSGSVMVKSKNIVLTTLEAGQPIGDMTFIDKGRRTATVAAIEEATLLKISYESFESLLEKELEMAVKIYKAIAVILSHRLQDLGQSINQRFQPSRF